MGRTGRSFALGLVVALIATAGSAGMVQLAFGIYSGTSLLADSSLWENVTSAGWFVVPDGGVGVLTFFTPSAGKPKGAYGLVQYADGDGGLLAAGATYINDGGVMGVIPSSSALLLPDAGSITLGARLYAKRPILATQTSAEPEYAAQESMVNGWPVLFNSTAGSTPQGDGSTFGATFTTGGTIVSSDSYARGLARGSPGMTVRNTLSTSFFQLATIYGQQLLFFRGNGAGSGGFYTVFDWAITQHPADDEMAMVGLYYRTSAIGGGTTPSTLLHTIFAGFDSTETVYKLCANGATGTASCVSCGANFPAGALSPVSTVYRLILYAAPSDANVTAELRRLDDATITPCVNTFPAGSGKLPNNNVFLAPHFWASNGSASSGFVYMRAMKFYGVPF